MSKTIQSIDRAFQILEMIAEGKYTKLNDITRHTKLKTSTVHGILTTLEKNGYIVKLPDTKNYSLSINCMMLGYHYKNRNNIDEHLHSFLNKLMKETMETVYFIIKTGDGYYFYDTVLSLHPLKVTTDPNKFIYMPPQSAVSHAYENYYKEDYTYSKDLENVYKGLHCMGIPYVVNNKVIGVFGITGPSSRFTVDKMNDAFKKFKRIAKSTIFNI